MIDFAGYRAAYDEMTYADIVGWHDKVWDLYPEQDKHSADHLEQFFAAYPATHVVEVGGWRGGAAAKMLAAFPSIESWRNYELCRGAAYAPITEDHRYVGVWPDDWVWRLAPPKADTAVLSHVIEHMRASQLRLLVGWLDAAVVNQVYVEAPLRQKPRSWDESSSFHVLEIGLKGVIQLFASHGFEVAERAFYPPDRRVVVFTR